LQVQLQVFKSQVLVVQYQYKYLDLCTITSTAQVELQVPVPTTVSLVYINTASHFTIDTHQTWTEQHTMQWWNME